MTLLDGLMPVSQEPVKPAKAKRRCWHRERQTRAVRQAAQEKLAAELRQKREAWAEELAQEQARAAATTWPAGVRPVVAREVGT